MQKNYLSKIAMSANPLVETIAKKLSKNTTTIWLLIMFTFLGFSNAFAQVSITRPNLTVTAYCSFPTNYYPLGNIVITEGQNSNFAIGTTRTLILSAPTNFEFQPANGAVADNNENVDVTNIVVTASTITITYNCTQTNKQDILTISGLQIRGINSASTGNITRTGGDGAINGLVTTPTATTLTNTLTSVLSAATPGITTNPANATINSGTNTSFTVAASNNPSSYTWEVSTDGGTTWNTVTNGGVYSGATTATLTLTAIPFTMNGYRYRARATNGCGSSSNSTVALLTVNLNYCTPTGSNALAYGHITNVNVNAGAINRTSGYDGYINTGLTTTLMKGFTYTLSIGMSNSSTTGRWTAAWADWNRNGILNDAGEVVATPTISNISPTDTRTLTFTVPAGASTGSVRFRVVHTYQGGTYLAPIPCTADFPSQSDWEDYTFNIIDAPACTTPTTQPTALNLTPSGTSIAGTFTAASPAPNSYLVVVSTSATPPSAPVPGTTYAIGSSLASGYIVVDNDTNTTFTATGLNTSTAYYFYIFSYNNLCTGGPLYNGTSPLTGNATTTATAPTYCGGVNPSSSATNGPVYINSVRSVGTITDVSNLNTGYTAGGYGNYSATTIATQIPGGGINIEMVMAGTYNSGPPSNCTNTSQFTRAWVDWNKDGDFDDAGELVFISGSLALPVATAIDNIFGFVVPTSTFPGNYRLRIRTKIYECDLSGGSAGIINPCGFHNTGETEDYTIAVVEDCPSKILTVTNGSACGPTNTVTLGATKTASATGFRWYTTLSGGAPVATTATGSWTTPSISVTTTYYVSAYDGVCETKHRTPVVATILPTSNITVTPSVPEVCGEDNVVQITASGDFVRETLILQDFESGMGSWNVTTPVNTSGGADTPWSVKTSVYVPAATSVWRPALNSGAVGTLGNKFAFTTSDYQGSNIETIMTSPVIDASLYNSLDLTFDQMYGAFGGDSAIIEASTNGTTWTEVATYTGTDIGTPSAFVKMPAIPLNTYAGNANLQIRFRYVAQWDDGWAVDNIKIEGVKPLNTTFTWTGGTVNAYTDAGLTTPYVAQSVSTVYVVPTAMQLASPSWSFTANATLGNGCPISQLISINNKTKLWKGSVDNNWYNPNNWSPVGVPDANTCVFIYPGSPATNTSNINTTANDGFAKSVTVRPSGILTIHPNNDLTVTDAVTVDAGGTFNIENSGSLIQVNNVANIGNISMKRNVNIRKLDYVYWSSPIANYGLTNISTTAYRYKWIPTIGSNLNGWGNWAATSETMVLGKGYIVRGPDSYTTTLQNYTQNFVGVPNNGTINTPVSRGTYDGVDYPTGVSATLATRNDDNWNLIGNPYPSAVNANLFLAANTNIAGFIKYWTHGTLPSSATSDPFYNNYVQNYTVGDYVTYNATGANPAIGNGNIGAGQGFFVLMNHTSGATTENVVFNNSMRRNDYRNDIFFRNANITDADTEEKHRIWLNLISPSATSSTALIGYVSGASNEIDRMYDAPALGVKTNFELYSLSNNLDQLNIQGKALPFNNEDQIPLGVNISQNGIHTIGISTVDGLFENNTQNIYLEDKTLGVTHDLRLAPYSFTATTGRTENRFVLKFNNETLGNDDFTANAVTVYTNEFININATNQTIKSVKVYDLLGRVLGTFNNVNSATFTSKNIAKTQTALLVEIVLDNGATKTYKVIF